MRSFNYIIVNLISFSDMTFDRAAAKSSALRYFNRMRREELPRDQDFWLVSESSLQLNASAMHAVLNVPPDTSRSQFIEQAARLYRRPDPQVPPGACGDDVWPGGVPLLDFFAAVQSTKTDSIPVFHKSFLEQMRGMRTFVPSSRQDQEPILEEIVIGKTQEEWVRKAASSLRNHLSRSQTNTNLPMVSTIYETIPSTKSSVARILDPENKDERHNLSAGLIDNWESRTFTKAFSKLIPTTRDGPLPFPIRVLIGDGVTFALSIGFKVLRQPSGELMLRAPSTPCHDILDILDMAHHQVCLGQTLEPFLFRELLFRFAPCHNRRPSCLQLTTLAAVAGIDVPLAASPDVVCHLVAGLPSAASALHGEDTFLSVSDDTQDRLIFVMSQLRLLYISTTVLMTSIAYETLPAPDVIAQLTLKSYQDVFFHLGALISLNLNGHTLPRVPVKVPRADVPHMLVKGPRALDFPRAVLANCFGSSPPLTLGGPRWLHYTRNVTAENGLRLSDFEDPISLRWFPDVPPNIATIAFVNLGWSRQIYEDLRQCKPQC